MALGFSHPVKYNAPEGIELKTDKMEITVSGADKQKSDKLLQKFARLRNLNHTKVKALNMLMNILIAKPERQVRNNES